MNLNIIRDRDRSELIDETEEENIARVMHLLDRGANVNQHDRDCRTALMVACENGYMDIVHLLLNRGANVNQQSNSGMTALMLACKNENENVDIVRLLIDRGAHVNQQSNS